MVGCAHLRHDLLSSRPDCFLPVLALWQVVARSALMKAPPPTPLKKGDLVRYPCDDHALEGTTRWQYGKVVKVYPGGELIDVDFDNGEKLHRQPTHDVLPARA